MDNIKLGRLIEWTDSRVHFVEENFYITKKKVVKQMELRDKIDTIRETRDGLMETIDFKRDDDYITGLVDGLDVALRTLESEE